MEKKNKTWARQTERTKWDGRFKTNHITNYIKNKLPECVPANDSV